MSEPEPRGGNISTYLSAKEWEAVEKEKEKTGGTRGSVLKAALRAYLKLDE